MGRLFIHYLTGPRVYVCTCCSSHLANHSDIVSKEFQGRHGKAYLFQSAINVTAGTVETRMLRTGRHQVADIFCNNCQEILGWKYEFAWEEDQKYKEGKYIIEKAKMKRCATWQIA
mmetsp:Transcript_21754/g.24283  ORF Transcript_21754/g.24283 Transcript_21754/m.24283 type:complete len:116 (-) Transcript_21754:1158-1505(-)